MYWKALRPIGELQNTNWGPADRLGPRRSTGAPVDRLGAAKLTGAYHNYHTDWRGIGSHSDRLGSCTPTGAPQTYLELLIPTGVQRTPD